MAIVSKNTMASSTPSSGTDYGAVQNPYTNSYLKENAWDRFVSSLGFTSAYDKAEAVRKSNYDAWESEHSEQIREDMYNSASEVVQREREAGLNPNLSGSAIGQGTDPSSAPTSVKSPMSESANMITDFGEMMRNVVGAGLQMADGITSVIGKVISNDNMSYANVANMFGLAEDSISKLSSTVNLGNDDLNDEEKLLQMLDEVGVTSVSRNIMSKRQYKKYTQVLRRMLKSNYGKELLADSINSSAPKIASASANQKIIKEFNQDMRENDFKPLSDFAEGITEAQIEAMKIRMKDLPMSDAQADLEESNARKNSASYTNSFKSIQDIFLKALEGQVKKLQSYSTSGTRGQQALATGLLSALGGVMMTGLPQISISDSQSDSHDENFRAGTSRDRHSMSKSLGFRW